MNRYALVNKKTSIVDNVTLWDGSSGWSAPTGYTAVQSDTANIGDTYANGVFTSPVIPPPVLTIDEARSAQMTVLESAYQSVIYADISYTSVGGVTQTYQADAGSVTILMQQISVYISSGATLPAGYAWTAADNTQVPFTVDDLKGLSSAIGARGADAFFHLQAQKAAVRAATTIADVQAITW